MQGFGDSAGGGYGPQPDYGHQPIPPVHQVHSVQYNTKGGGHGKDKELILKNLFEIALTAIAFISFGCFILQVIMCIVTAVRNFNYFLYHAYFQRFLTKSQHFNFEKMKKCTKKCKATRILIHSSSTCDGFLHNVFMAVLTFYRPLTQLQLPLRQPQQL